MAALLIDAEQCEFVGVSIAEHMGLEESLRLARRLEGLRIPMRRLLINGIVPEEAASGCDFCSARRRAQVSVLREFRRRLGRRVELFIAPQQPREIHGAKRLKEHFKAWRALADF